MKAQQKNDSQINSLPLFSSNKLFHIGMQEQTSAVIH